MTTPPLLPPFSPALERFLKSMHIGFIEWHDGIGYDLDALKEMTPTELGYVEKIILPYKDRDWRDVETLATLNTPDSIQALKECLNSSNNDARLFAVRLLKEMNIVDRIEEIILDILPKTKIGQGLTYALSLAETYPTEAIRRKVLWCALNGNDDIRIHCAAMALYLYGKAASTFDNTFTIIFEFREPSREGRIAPFVELCRLVDVDPTSLVG